METPNFFLIGAPRCGTTALVDLIEQHRDVFTTIVKEPNYFNYDVYVDNDSKFDPAITKTGRKFHHACVREARIYRDLYKDSAGYKVVGDYSVMYLRSMVAPRIIKENCTDPKFLVVVRNPIDRAASHWQMDAHIGRNSRNFLDSMNQHLAEIDTSIDRYENYVRFSLYYEDIAKYITLFGRDAVKVAVYDDFQESHETYVQGIFQFLGLETEGVTLNNRRLNELARPRYPRVNRLLYEHDLKQRLSRLISQRIKDPLKKLYYVRTRQNLPAEPHQLAFWKTYFRPDIENLSRLIDRDLTGWLA